MKQRLDEAMVEQGLTQSRSHASRLIKLHKVEVNKKLAAKSGQLVSEKDKIVLKGAEDYVSRSGYKLAGAVDKMKVNFKDKAVLDVGSSTGGFTDYSLKHGAKKVYAVDVGTNQLHPSLHNNPNIELHEQTDIRDFKPEHTPDIVVIDVSFISSREVLPHLASISDKNTEIIAMVKPQFEAGRDQVNKGVIKNDRIRRDILKSFETWVKQSFVIKDQADSEVAGSKGNVERFYLLKLNQ